MIRLEHITRRYGQGDNATQALNEVDLQIPSGAFVTVVGTSGSGKTTLLNVLGGLDTDYSGTALLAGTDLKSLDDRALSRFRNEMVGFVFQHFHLLEHLTATQNVTLASFFAADQKIDLQARAEGVLVRVGLKDRMQHFPSQLSGGQKQRVAIARALFHQPKLILADEPTGNLDTRTSAQIIALFESLNQQEGLTIVVVTHEDFLFRCATHTVRIEDGRLVEVRRS